MHSFINRSNTRLNLTLVFSVLVTALLLVGCDRQPTALPTPLPSATPSLSPAELVTTSVPEAKNTARQYLEAWTREDYPAMYAMLTPLSQDAITEADFTQKYKTVAAEAALSKPVSFEILSSLTEPQSAQVMYRVIMHSVLVGDLLRDTKMSLSLEAGSWRVQWDDTLILPELAGGNRLEMVYKVPARANIYDRNGHALVAQTDAVSIGINPADLSSDAEDSLLSLISTMTKGRVQPSTLTPYLETYRQYNYYLPVTDMAADVFAPYQSALSSYGGVVLQSFKTRYYLNEVAPHVTGYMSAIQADEVEKYARLGYEWNERVGRDGLELWGEQYLAGKRGGTLYVIAPDGTTVTILADTATQSAQAVTTTIDRDLQIGVQQALTGWNGAVVVLERDTGRVLAMASSPGFNPNLYEPTNFNSQYQLAEVYNDPNAPLINRATQGLYPLGSVFKIITMSAALQSGRYTPDYQYNCGYHFEELGGVVLHDWTWEHFQEDGKTQPSGLLTLPEGLIRSCNPFFYHIGRGLYLSGATTVVSDMARGFGLGAKTGIELAEEAGNIPDPASEIDATNNSIGQGATQVTPIQVARFVAALGNGGTLLKPTVIQMIAPPDGEPTYVFTPTVQGTLPIGPGVMETVQEAMVGVVEDRGGTARQVFAAMTIPIAGKTGTAQDPPRDPHAWFVGYTFAERENEPDIAIAVVVENAGEGSEIAAPIFRGIVQLYFNGTRGVFPWESAPGVWREPTPTVTETPVEQPTETPEP